MRFEFGLHMPVQFYQDPSRFAGVIREKPILSKYILDCHACAWQRTIIYFINIPTTLLQCLPYYYILHES